MREFMNITKALLDENRIRTLLALRHGELCVCQITELFRLEPLDKSLWTENGTNKLKV